MQDLTTVDWYRVGLMEGSFSFSNESPTMAVKFLTSLIMISFYKRPCTMGLLRIKLNVLENENMPQTLQRTGKCAFTETLKCTFMIN
jgi:hypothetical protein